MKILTVVGARPQFIKAAVVSREIREHHVGSVSEIIVHTGQHYDENMSAVFFRELDIPIPEYNLEISGGSHGAMTGRMMESLEQVLEKERPDCLMIYGDTNSTLAGALVAAKLHIPIAHIEAGLRSFNMRMPEEVNRIVADRLSSWLFCPTEEALLNLANEGLSGNAINVGDVMYDGSLYYRDMAREKSQAMHQLSLKEKAYALATCHRAENTDDPLRLREILQALAALAKDMPVVLPLHPRTRKLVSDNGLSSFLSSLRVVEPLPFLDMVALEQGAAMILTDSGGVQKEAFFYGVPCVTMRNETEWVETVALGWNQLAGASCEQILAAARAPAPTPVTAQPYGNGKAAARIMERLLSA